MQTAQIEIGTDGQIRCARFGDVYASAAGAWAQAHEVYLAGIELPSIAARHLRLRILELGFGLATNFLATWSEWRRHAPQDARLDYLAVEAYPLTRAQWHSLPDRPGVPRDLLAQLVGKWPDPIPGLHLLSFDAGRVRLLLWLGEVSEGLAAFDAPTHGAYLDGFAPNRNPAMWTSDVCRALQRLLAGGARAASYSVARTVRDQLAAHGFQVHKAVGFSGKRERLIAVRFGRADGLDPRPVAGPVAVIGAGIAGLAAASALHEHGCAVTLFDPGGLHLCGASGNAAVLVHAEPGTGLPVWLHNHGLRLALSCLRRAALTDPEMLALPGVRASDGTCLEGGWLYPQRLAVRLGEPLALKPSVVSRILPEEDGWILCSARRRYRFAHVVLACGSGARRLWPSLASRLEPVAGQVELLRGDFTALCAQPALGDRWLIPLDTGKALAGASFLPGVRDRRLRARQTQHTMRTLRAQHGLAAADWTVDSTRAGVRMVSPDRRPIAGPVGRSGAWLRDGWPQAWPGLWASLAHGSRGFVSAFLAAELLTGAILGVHPAVPRELRLAVDPRRFERR